MGNAGKIRSVTIKYNRQINNLRKKQPYVCGEDGRTPQAARGMVFSARARLGIPHTESGVNKDSQEPRVRGRGGLTEKKS